jgi:transposase
MSETTKIACAACAAKDAEIAKLREQLAAAKKNSTNSSKPPSSDIVDPKKKERADTDAPKRTIGGQPGHPAHFRQLFDALDVNRTEVHPLHACPRCGSGVRPNGDHIHRFQQVEIVLPTLSVTEHQCPDYWCEACGQSCQAELPLVVQRGGMAGPMLTTVVAFLKGCCHASYSTIRLFLRDVAGLQIARSMLAKVIAHVTAALDAPYDELLGLLPEQDLLNVDETGHPENGKLLWTWCLKAQMFTLFQIAPSRGSDVLIDLLGREFDGVLGCDYFSAYRKFMKDLGIAVQFCLAHLIRDVKFLCALPDRRDQAFGISLRIGLKELFAVIHRREQLSDAAFRAALESAKAAIFDIVKQAPETKPAQVLAKRFATHGESYFTFITTPGMDPTNNAAERAIRFVVMDRHVTQGTRGEKGRRWCERIWTVLATCQQRGVSAFAFLRAAISCWMEGRPAPSLLSGKFAAA